MPSSELVQLSFVNGIDESQEPEVLDPMSAFPVLENVRQDRYGGASKRLGYGSLSTTRLDNTSRTAGRRMFMNGNHLAIIDGSKVDAYAPTASARPNIDRGRVPEASCRLRESVSHGPFDLQEDIVVVNGFIVVSSIISTGGVTYHASATLDEATGTVVRGPETVDSGVLMKDARLASYGNYAIAFTCDDNTSEIRAKYLDLTSASTINSGWQSIGTLTSDWNIGFDCAICQSNDRVAIAFGADSGAAQKITVKTLNISGAIQSVDIATTNALGAANARTIALAENADTLWVAYFDGQDLKVQGRSPTTLSTVLASVLTVTTLGGAYSTTDVYVCGGSAAGTCTVYGHGFDGTTYALTDAMFVQNVTTSAGAATASGSLVTIGGAYMQSRPFLRGTRIYARMDSRHVDTPYDGVLCDVTLPGAVPYMRPVAAPVQRGLHGTTLYWKCRTAAIDTARYVSTVNVIGSITSFVPKLVEYDFGDPDRWRPAYLNGSTYLSGGITSVMDGARVFEMAFLGAPKKPQTNNTTGTGLTLTNGRKYVVTYEYVDSDGRRHISGCSDPCAISGGQVNKTVVVKTTPCTITSKGDVATLAGASVRAVFWATLDSNNGQPPYYRLGYVQSDPGLPLITFTDAIVDNDLATGELLYGTGSLPGTDGSSQDHRAPCGWSYMVSYNDMLVGAQGANLYWSAQNIDGEGAWTSPVFSIAVEDDIIGLAVQDGAVIGFTKSGAFSVSGDPPSDNGLSGGLGAPRRIHIDHPCINAGSILTTDVGTFYQSARGIELLTRGQSNKWIGQEVQVTTAAYPYVSSAVLDARNGLARFSLTTSETDGAVASTGVDLIFDMALGKWISKDIKRGGSASQASQDACVAYLSGERRYAWLATDGTVYYERSTTDGSAYLDGSTWVTMAAETASFKLGGIHGKQILNFVLALIRKSTDFDVSIALAYDFSSSFKTATTWLRATIATLLSSLPALRLKHVAHDDAECQGVRIRITDATPTGGTVGTGKGGTWLALAADITPQDGAYDVPEEAA